MPPKKYAHPDPDRCASCGACTRECPKGAITVWKGCYSVVDISLCVGCGQCARVCPTGCIELKDREEAGK